MNILILCYEFPPIGGGTGKALSELLWEFTNHKEININVLTSHQGKGILTERYSDNVWIFKIGIKKKSLYYWRMPELLRWHMKAWIYYKRLLRQKYDLVHSFFGFPTALIPYLTRKKVPYIISLRGSDVPGFNSRALIPKKLNDKIWNEAQDIVCNSYYLANLSGLMKSTIIYNGAKIKFVHRKRPERLTALTVGRLIKRKRIDWIIKACSNVNLIITGDGPEREHLENIAGKNVKFLGHKEPDYTAADVYISASEHEGMSNSILEAMSSGLPLIVSRCSSELVKNNGYVINSPEQIKEALGALDLDKFSMASIELSRKHSWKEISERYIELYKKVSCKETNNAKK